MAGPEVLELGQKELSELEGLQSPPLGTLDRVVSLVRGFRDYRNWDQTWECSVPLDGSRLTILRLDRFNYQRAFSQLHSSGQK